MKLKSQPTNYKKTQFDYVSNTGQKLLKLIFCVFFTSNIRI